MSMDGAQETKAAVARLDRLFESRLKLTRGDFGARAAKARRRLPHKLRKDLARILEARRFADHPKLARTLDAPSIRAAAGRLERHLQAVDLAAQRRARLLNLLASVMAGILVVVALVVMVLRWRGFV
ncbi:hypothetical protein KUV62_11785 [Salipiger bermudensis]|uniref:hypothetical protein n=1 Tax=Salipiger bermudensis TaxID=344736 RepID=UPI001C99385F|nr:hypothetical protein [Salipiger bermudensis]MBY6004595.1 hypothetical protein [Salipiger bermudensis]